MIKKLILFSLIVLVFSCTQSGDKEEKNNDSTAIDIKTSKESKIEIDSTTTEYSQLKSPKANKFKVLEKPLYDISKLTFNGEIIYQEIWEDANGENIVLFTKSKEELFVYHYSVIKGEVRLLRRVYDFVKDCDADLTLEFLENSIGVTDIDNNNLGEIAFAYLKACISDVSPKQLKLLMLENGNKYIIRGTTAIDMPGMKIASTKNVDTSFTKAPADFLKYADKIWEEVKIK